MATQQPAGQQRNAWGRDHGNYASFATMPNGVGNVLPAASVPFTLEVGDTCMLTSPTGLGARYTCVDPGTAGGGDAVWIFTGSYRPVFVTAPGSRDLTVADDGAVLIFTAVAGATAVVKANLPERFGCALVRYTGAGPLAISDDGGATTLVLPASRAFLPSVSEAGGAVGVDVLAATVARLSGDLTPQAPTVSIAAAGPLVGDSVVATTGGVVSAYQWYRGSVFGGSADEVRAPIRGATASTYVRTALDVGYNLICVVTGPGGTGTSNVLAGAASFAALGIANTLDLTAPGLTGNPLTAAANAGSAGGSWVGAGATAPLRGSVNDVSVQQSIGSFMTSPLTDASYFAVNAIELAFVVEVGTAALVTADVAAALWYTGRAMIADYDLGAPRFGVMITKSGCYVGIYNGVAFVSTITTGFAAIKCDQPTVVHVRLSADGGGTLGIKVGSGAEVTLAAAGAIDVLANHLATFANWGATLNLTGKIGEPIGNNVTWTAAEKTTVRAWLGNKYAAEY